MRKYLTNLSNTATVTTINRKSHVVDLLQLSVLGAFIHVLLSHAYLCVSLAVSLQGMVDPGEAVTTTVKREFIEEAMDSLALSEDDQKRLVQQISDFFKKYSEVRGAEQCTECFYHML